MRWWRNLRARMRGRVRPGYWDLVETHFHSVSIYDGPEVFLADLSTVPEPSRNLLAAHWTQSEIQNGGLAQFFFNSTGVLAPEAISGFAAIGMAEASDILVEAMRLFPQLYPRHWEDRLRPFQLPQDPDGRVAFAKFAELTTDVFEPLDEKFWTLMRDENNGFLVRANRYAEEARHAE